MGTPAVTRRAAERRSREREARVAQIRAGAERVFARHGYEHATMEMVAEAAELGKATLYYYFRNKHELFADMVTEAARALGERARAELSHPSDDPLAAVESLCRFSLDFLQERPDLAVVLLPLMAGGNTRLEESLGREVAQEVAAGHAPLYHSLATLCGRLPGGEHLMELISSLLLGLSAKLRSGAPASAQAEIELFFVILRRACAHPVD